MGESRPHFSGLDYQRAYAQLKWKRGCALKARQQQQQQQQLLLEAPPATPEPAVSTTANTVDPSTTQGEAIDATATSRKGDSPTSWLCQKMRSQDFSPDFPATQRVCAYHRHNLVVVDTHLASDPSTLLQVATTCEVKVKCKQLINNKCVGMVFGVDQRIDVKDYAANITSPVPMTSCVHQGKCLTMERFSAGYPALGDARGCVPKQNAL